MELIDSITVSDIVNDFVPVSVNGAAIDEAEILQEMQYHSAETVEAAHQKAASALVVKELMLQRAKELELTAQVLTGENQEEALIRTLLVEEVKQPAPDEEACERYFLANQEKFTTPTLIAASHILLGADPQDQEAREFAAQQAESIIATLVKDPDSFADLAKQYSDCPSKEVNGELGQLEKGQTVAEFERQVFKMQEGLALHAVESRYGYHIVRLDKRVEGEPLPYNMVADRIATYLKDQVYRRSISQYVSLLAGQASIEGIDIQGADSLLMQ
ncbi:peptidylprolyl isomerase [Neptunomonas japonica]|uniref:peptidylprolyl isomerase n=1 Tax=Neptunomonas japonica JAMM 1380 TaxID=1441457 RepID=A0A7R6SXG8_9GAMM|nr:peptidylprolyl isomerase [Neptunomonas japonica]BBB30795.1 peptidyl-prolyl cis-trans isomerase C [Neptunomonas japonica JAMM 1380]